MKVVCFTSKWRKIKVVCLTGSCDDAGDMAVACVVDEIELVLQQLRYLNKDKEQTRPPCVGGCAVWQSAACRVLHAVYMYTCDS